MAGVEVKTFEKADEVNNNFNNAKIEITAMLFIILSGKKLFVEQ